MNIDTFQPVLDWMIVHPYWAYTMIFLLSLTESLVVVGLIVPGIAIMSIIGAFIGAGYLSLWPTMAVSIFGAIIGDGLSYLIGKHFQQHIRDWWVFRKFPEIMIRCEKFFAKHGGKSIIFGRFVGPVRPMIPAIAGMMKMPPGYFYLVNIISACLWAPVYLYPGVLFGNTLAGLPPEVSKKIITVVVLVILFLWITIKIIKSLLHTINRRYRRIGTRIWMYAEHNSLYYLQKIIKHPLQHKRHQVDNFLVLLSLLLGTITFIILTNYRVLTTSGNAFFKHFALLFYDHGFSKVLIMLDHLTSVLSLTVIFVGYLIYFVCKNYSTHNKTANVRYLITLSVSLLLVYFATSYVISYIVKYPRPFAINFTESYIYYYSFPSIRMGLLTLLVGYIGIIKYCNSPSDYNKSYYNFTAIMILVLFFLVKIILGYSWLSDLLGGMLIAGCLLLAFCILYWQAPIQNINNKHLNIFSGIFITLAVIINSAIFYNINIVNNFEKYNIKTTDYNPDSIPLTMETWLSQTNLFHAYKDPIINIQWLGDEDQLVNTLAKNGWYRQPHFNFKTVLKFFENNPEIKELPMLPSYYRDHNANIVLSKVDSNNKIINLRLWESEYKIDELPLWIGTIQYLKPQKFFDLFTVLTHWPRAEFADVMDKLEVDIKKIHNLDKTYIYDQHYFLDEDLKIMLIN